MFTAHLISKTEAILLVLWRLLSQLCLMCHSHLVSHSHVQMRLQDADDPAIAAAWHVYMETHDFNDLADTMLRILRREARLATQRAVDPQVSAIHELVQVGGLTPEEGTGLLASLAVDHKARVHRL